MTFVAVRCPHCQSEQIVKRGKTARGTQRYLCQNALCTKGSFLLDSCNRGCLPEVKQTIIDMSLNASGVRDTARSLHICPNTVLRKWIKSSLGSCTPCNAFSRKPQTSVVDFQWVAKPPLPASITCISLPSLDVGHTIPALTRDALAKSDAARSLGSEYCASLDWPR